MADLTEYHRGIAAGNRAAILAAAADLFLERGYDATALARVAERAGVSKATLFKQFPTKAELFEATVLAAAGTPVDVVLDPPAGDLEAGLVQLGRAYAAIFDRPHIEGLMRTIIGDSTRFPELRERVFDFGTLPVLAALRRHLAHLPDGETATRQFLGMIASQVFWPRLMHGTWSITDEEVLDVVDEAARTIVARFG